MTTKNKIITGLVILAVVVMLSVIGYFVINRMNSNSSADTVDLLQEDENSQAVINGLESEDDDAGKVGEKNTEITEGERQKISAKNRAKFFIEMVGTYSTEARFQNIEDLKPMMTASMRAWADDFIDRNMQNIALNKEKVTTNVFRMDVLYQSDSRIAFLASARMEEMASSGSKIYNQNVEIYLILAGDDWLVDEVVWK